MVYKVHVKYKTMVLEVTLMVTTLGGWSDWKGISGVLVILCFLIVELVT